MIRVGSLCSGAEVMAQGLALAGVEHQLVFVADNDPAAAKVLAYRYPATPNLGDITAVDWTAVERVDLITAGFPCQDVSLAGRRAGIAEGTRSGLWTHIVHIIDIVRPPYVLIENVRGLLSARADSDVEPCPWCLGNRGGHDQEPVLRALGAVLGDLSDLGFDAEWVTVAAGRKKASDIDHVGAPHQRERVFVLATAADAPRLGHGDGGTQSRRGIPAAAVTGGDTALVPTPGARLGRATSITPAAAARRLNEQGKHNLDDWAALLPTPRASANENRQTKRSPSQKAGTHGLSLAAEVCALLPTPRATDGTHGGPNQRGSSGDLMLLAAVQPERWGDYAAAVARWEQIIGRPAPEPTELSETEAVRLSPRFVEWMQGLPEGWVCDVPGVSGNDASRLLGNGPVLQQVAYAWRMLTAGAS